MLIDLSIIKRTVEVNIRSFLWEEKVVVLVFDNSINKEKTNKASKEI